MRTILKIFFLCLLVIFNSGEIRAESGLEKQPASQEMSDEQAHYLVLHGTPEDVKKLLQSGYDVNRIHSYNTLLNTAIKSAAKGSQMSKHPSYALEKIKILVDAGADVNFVPCSQKTMSALSWAISLPTQVGYTEQMVNKIIDERIKNRTGECNIPDVVLKPCKDITPAEREEIRKALHSSFTIMNKIWVPYFMDIVKYLVSKGANVNGSKENGMGMTPLHLAAVNPEEITLEPLKYLIKSGAKLNIQDSFGNTPLFLAFGSGNNEAVKLLIENGADISIRNNDGALFNEVAAEKMHSFIGENGEIISNKL